MSWYFSPGYFCRMFMWLGLVWSSNSTSVLSDLFCLSFLLMIITGLLLLNHYTNDLAELWKPSDEFSLFFRVSQLLIMISSDLLFIYLFFYHSYCFFDLAFHCNDYPFFVFYNTRSTWLLFNIWFFLSLGMFLILGKCVFQYREAVFI